MGAFKLDYGDYFYCTKKCSKSNHLGNVLTLFTDKKIPVGTGATVSYYKADLVSSMDYSPFGAPLKGRTFNASGSRYGFNGKENDNEVKGTGNQQDYGFRIYDNRLGRFLSVDPLTKEYPYYTPYQFSGNIPIRYIDVDGLEPGDPMNYIWSGFGDATIAIGDFMDNHFAWGTDTKTTIPLSSSTLSKNSPIETESGIEINTNSESVTSFGGVLRSLKYADKPLSNSELPSAVTTSNTTNVSGYQQVKIKTAQATVIEKTNANKTEAKGEVAVETSMKIQNIPLKGKISTASSTNGTTQIKGEVSKSNSNETAKVKMSLLY